MTRPPCGGQHSLAVILLALELVLGAGASFRGAATTLAILARSGYLHSDTPAASTIRMWLIRLGCARLTRPLAADAGPWLWLVDHTLQIGSHKLLVIVGCPLAQVPFGQRPLAFADLELIAVVPMESSNAKLVCAELTKASQRTGIPGEIASDQGGDLAGGIMAFQRCHRQIRAVPDVAHAVANLLKHYREHDERWQAFIQRMQQTASAIRQTQEAYLLAPKLRAKARYMSVAVYVRFGGMLVRHLQMANPREEVVRRYEWVRGYAKEINIWAEQHAAAQIVLRHVREEGLFKRSRDMVEQEWQTLSLSDDKTTQLFLNRLRGYLTRHTTKLKPGERLVGSTEILESLFSVLKRVSGEQAQSGLTMLTLSLGAIIGHHTAETARQDLEAVPEKEAQGWAERVLGKTLQWCRRDFAKATLFPAVSPLSTEPTSR